MWKEQTFSLKLSTCRFKHFCRRPAAFWGHMRVWQPNPHMVECPPSLVSWCKPSAKKSTESPKIDSTQMLIGMHMKSRVCLDCSMEAWKSSVLLRAVNWTTLCSVAAAGDSPPLFQIMLVSLNHFHICYLSAGVRAGVKHENISLMGTNLQSTPRWASAVRSANLKCEGLMMKTAAERLTIFKWSHKA